MTKKALLAALAGITLAGAAQAQNKVQVFILAGQSNMEGKGQVAGVTTPGTLEYMVANDPANFGHLVSSGTNNWITRSDVSIASTTGPGNSLINGGLTVGFGSSSNQIGPELGFGSVIGDAYTEDVLIIKTAWGGKSLQTDFRPPSAVLNRGGEVGFYYNEILNQVNTVLGDIGTYAPGYTDYEIKGFGWHQGFNDRINTSATAEYEANMVDFINDIRFDLGAADLPFVIANTAIDADAQYGGNGLTGNGLILANAQLGVGNLTIDPTDPNQIAVTSELLYPEFDGNVKAVNAVPYWRLASNSPVPGGNQGFHWNQSGESYYLFGEAMGEMMATMSDYEQFERQYVEVNLQTGEIKIINPDTNTGSFDLEAYQITSASGALDAAAWQSITGNYDGNGDGSVDIDNWTIDFASVNQLGESAEVGGVDGSIATGTEVSLGVGAWIQNLTKDLTATYTDTDGNVQTLYIRYTGNDNIAADLNFDGVIDIADWDIFITGAQTDMTGLSLPESYQLGDLDGDLDNDIRDYVFFKNEFELANPQAGAFEAMLAEYAVPEPSSFILFAGAATLCVRRRRPTLIQASTQR
jgi:alpha-galactosidase